MHHWFLIFVSLFTTSFVYSAPATENSLLSSKAYYQARFEKGVPIKGTAVRELRKIDDDTWEYRFDVDSLVADIKESVAFKWDDGRVTPLNYRYKLSGFFIKDRKSKTSFDYQQRQILNEYKGKKKTLPWEVPVYDKLGYQLQLIKDLNAGKRYMSYRVVDKGKIKDYVFQVVGEESLQTKIGLAETVILEKVRSKSSKRKTLLWFAKNWHHLLVKMKQTESDGEKYEINIIKADVGQLSLQPQE